MIIILLCRVKIDLERFELNKKKFDTIIFEAYVVLSYVLLLRGSKGLILNLITITKLMNEERIFFFITLKEKLKEEWKK